MTLAMFVLATSCVSTNVSLEIKGERLERAASAIGEALGVSPLEISNPLRNDVLAFRCTNVSAQEAIRQLERAVNATFVKKTSGWLLEQTLEQRTLDQRRQREFHFKEYDRLVQSCQRHLTAEGVFDEKAARALQKDLKQLSMQEVSSEDEKFYDRVRAAEVQSPITKFTLRLVGRLQTKDWMPLSRTRPRIVYSLHPTKTQQPMPFSIQDLTDQLVREQGLWVDLFGNEPLEGPKYRESDGTSLGRASLGNVNELRQRFGPDSFANVTCVLTWGINNIDVQTYGKDGSETTVVSTLNLPLEPEPAKPAPDKAVPPFKPTQEMKWFNMIFRGDRSRVMAGAVPEALVDKLLRPEEVDPLAICAYAQFAHSAGKRNFALVLDDAMIGAEEVSFLELENETSRYEVSQSDAWVTAVDQNALESRVDRVDRRAAAKIFALIHKRKQDLSLEERAEFIATQPVMMENDSYVHHVGTMLGQVGVRGYRDPASHRIYGTLSEAERLAIATKPLPIRSVSTAVQSCLTFEVFMRPYGSYPTMVSLDHEKLSPALQTEFDKVGDLVRDGIYHESTFMVPSGLTGNELLSSSESNSVTLVCAAPMNVENGFGRVLTPESLGRFLAQREVPELRAGTMGLFEPDLNAIWMGNRRTITLTLQVNKYAKYQWTLSDTSASTNLKKMTLEELPDAILARVRTAKATALKDFARAQSRSKFKDSNPPPNFL